MPNYAEFLYGEELYGTGEVSRFQKRYIYKVYDANSLVAIWSDDVLSVPSFNSVINGGSGELNIDLKRGFENYGEGVDVKLGNRVDIVVYDRDDADGLLLYRGFISSYSPTLDSGKETVSVTLLPYISQISHFLLREADGTTKITYSNSDPTNIFLDIISKFQRDGGVLETSGGTQNLTGTSVGYVFNTSTTREAFDKALSLSPPFWYWRIDPDNIFTFKRKSTTADHDLIIGEHVNFLSFEKRLENVVNRVYVVGGGDPPLYRVYSRPSSISTYGLRVKRVVSQGVITAADAQIVAAKILDENEEPEVRLRVRVLDNNGVLNDHGYDIESIKPGDTVRIKNINFGTQTTSLWDEASWDSGVWDYTLQSISASPLVVVRTTYHPNYLELETSSKFPRVEANVDGIGMGLSQTQTKDNPIAPS